MTKNIAAIAGEGKERRINYVVDSDVAVKYGYCEINGASKKNLVVALNRGCSK